MNKITQSPDREIATKFAVFGFLGLILATIALLLLVILGRDLAIERFLGSILGVTIVSGFLSLLNLLYDKYL